MKSNMAPIHTSLVGLVPTSNTLEIASWAHYVQFGCWVHCVFALVQRFCLCMRHGKVGKSIQTLTINNFLNCC